MCCSRAGATVPSASLTGSPSSPSAAGCGWMPTRTYGRRRCSTRSPRWATPARMHRSPRSANGSCGRGVARLEHVPGLSVRGHGKRRIDDHANCASRLRTVGRERPMRRPLRAFLVWVAAGKRRPRQCHSPSLELGGVIWNIGHAQLRNSVTTVESILGAIRGFGSK